ncbi:tRNA uridine-5-carboxymethylaminomethyl(34) synthesis enzyme MnmG [Blochmannia endosymbiont of Polyrhachis (Hedomyrma) turneri]|uniref:tRNA uridine-5-carboxymethylaminomethyl(34) synthesis enzyme MnmG n=1 Tax=Blochmannia endosymbiont of Polyrhachis (Hedomyrma) turneri TaxID=1505596 RepID=UPI00061A7355|nr:tRNA uridine-5-carboxymethylaminomethyl(34) synthesis enzyme MnmG [Blochmannia endosymbiont of Polyrhachis (Hedomyrma) turneri]AKC59597.1 tRNA uridine 5-carboxymethylaminomethyl modification enzyme MnmG [Blochmannia endosymbiont of Polyrhachis (Hedomyrma) turneri]
MTPLSLPLPKINFEVIIIGGGHAGIEAAWTTSKKKCKTLLLTHNIKTIGEMFCNPSIGGIGKSHLVKEIDAMGGLMGHAADYSGIQFRTLNTSKGRAVRSTRAQIDKKLYKKYIQLKLKQQKYLTILEATVSDLIIYNNIIQGVVLTLTKEKIFTKTVILCTGTFLNGKIYIGMNEYYNKKIGNLKLITTAKISQQLQEIGFQTRRLKTGTSPRVNKNSINFSSLVPQYSEQPIPFFSFFNTINMHPKQIPCYITHTNKETHKIISNNLHHSPLFTKKILGIGPRYCPSIEDKIIRFPHHESHQIFLEPEGSNSSEIYLNGISTSLPLNVQIKILRSIKGLEHSKITKPGYAIEYDFFDPTHLKLTLESKLIHGLFFAGQINGTTGYEEAAAQGLIAGINAALFVNNHECWFPRRNQAYIGVLIDDLCTQGVDEPYRMFTSRAEHRLLLRENNADIRLTEIARKLFLIDDRCWNIFCEKQNNIKSEYKRLKNIWIYPCDQSNVQSNLLSKPLQSKISIKKLLCRPEINFKKLINLGLFKSSVSPLVLEEIETQIKYKGYIDRQNNEIARQLRNEMTYLPNDIDYSCVTGLSTEVIHKLNNYQPTSLGQASRISGITPSSISILLIWLKKQGFMSCLD